MNLITELYPYLKKTDKILGEEASNRIFSTHFDNLSENIIPNDIFLDHRLFFGEKYRKNSIYCVYCQNTYNISFKTKKSPEFSGDSSAFIRLLNKLDDSHFSAVSASGANLKNSCVTAVSVSV